MSSDVAGRREPVRSARAGTQVVAGRERVHKAHAARSAARRRRQLSTYLTDMAGWVTPVDDPTDDATGLTPTVDGELTSELGQTVESKRCPAPAREIAPVMPTPSIPAESAIPAEVGPPIPIELTLWQLSPVVQTIDPREFARGPAGKLLPLSLLDALG